MSEKEVSALCRPRPVDPLDVGCGLLVPLRWSSLCAVYHYDRHAECRPHVVEDKPYEMHVLVQTTAGQWQLGGRRGWSEIDVATVVAGRKGTHYGCRHDRHAADRNTIVSLRPGAIDEDQPLFERDTVGIDLRPGIERALRAADTDRFDSLVFELFNQVSDHSIGKTAERALGHVRMQRLKRFIENHAFEEISLGEIAACVNLSPFTCLRQFRRHMGVTPHEYMDGLRLRRARELLRSSKLDVAIVAASVGMRDPCYFSRWFTKHAGVSPARFRSDAA